MKSFGGVGSIRVSGGMKRGRGYSAQDAGTLGEKKPVKMETSEV